MILSPKSGWLNTDKGKAELLQENPVPLRLCPPLFSHGLVRDRGRASAVTGRHSYKLRTKSAPLLNSKQTPSPLQTSIG